MRVNLMDMKKEMRKTSLVLWAVSFALLMQAHPLWAMNDKSDVLNQGAKGLRDDNYYKVELEKLEKSTRRIHQEVDRILREFRENMKKYYQLTRGKGMMASKGVAEIKIANAEQKGEKNPPLPLRQQQHDLKALEEAYKEWDQLIAQAVFARIPSDSREEEKRFLYETMDETMKPRKLEYTDRYNNTTHFVTCLTIGDGNCYFYAAFTDQGEDTEYVRKESIGMRQTFLKDLINDETANSLKNFVSKEYWNHLDNSNIPEKARKIIVQHKDEDLEDQYQKISKIISAGDIRTFFNKIDQLGVDETYITIDEREQIIDPADLLSKKKKKQIHIFTPQPLTNKLKFIKTVGDGNSKNAINVLYDNGHFTRLYAYASEKDQCDQIFLNYYYLNYIN